MQAGELLRGRYHLQRELAQGGMGRVWVAYDVELERQVAIKIIQNWSGQGQEFFDRIRREAPITARIQHPGITTIYDVGSHEGQFYFVMELLEGRDVSQLLRNSPDGISMKLALNLCIQLADALEAAHRAGVVHRDVKPGNLVMLENGILKVCDFGIAGDLRADPTLFEDDWTGVGTAAYMAPEQWELKPVTARTDLYGMGCVLYELLTGHGPFKGPDMESLRVQHVQVVPPLPVTQFPLPELLVELLMRLLEKDPVNRPESAAAVARKLERIRDAFYNPEVTVADRNVSPSSHGYVDGGDSGLIFRAYVPSDRLYAAELDKFLSLFRGWLSSVRGQGVRQGGYQTQTGKVYEFYQSEDSADVDLDQERADFSEFLAMCVNDPPAAARRLVREGMGQSEAVNFASRYGREIRRLNLDLKHERERRVLEIWHGIESDLIDSDAYSEVVMRQLKAILESLVPDLSVDTYRNILEAGRWSEQTAIEININQQIISAVEGAVIQNVGGNVNLGPRAKELLALIDTYGGPETNSLRTALYEVEDKHAPIARRREAKKKLGNFLRQVGGVARDAAVDLLEKYLEKKLGI